MDIYVDAKDFEKKVVKFMRKTDGDLGRAILNAYADEAVTRAGEECPKDTGNLRSTIRKEEISGEESKRIKITAGGIYGNGGYGRGGKKVGSVFVDYAAAVHEGHVTRNGFVAGRPFLTHGAQLAAATIPEERIRAVFDYYKD